MVTTKIEKLDNGLQLILCQDPSKHTTYAELLTNFGGMRKDYISNGEKVHLIDGIAHLLEHTLIDNSKYGNVLQYFNEKHVTFNGVTSRLTTSFFVDTVKNFNEILVELINIVNVANFDEESLRETKKPIYDEIRKNDDTRFYKYNCAYTKSIFVNTDFKNNLGTLEEIKEVSYETVKKCHDTFYHPSNQTLMISGNFDIDEVIKLVEDTYKEINKPKIDFEYIDIDLSDKLDKKEHLVIDEKEDELVNITFKVDISKLSPFDGVILAYYIAYFLRYNFDDSSELFQDMVDKKYSVFSIDNSIIKLGDYIFVDATCFTKEKDYFVSKVLEIIKNKDIIDEEKFTLLKKREIVNQILKEENCNAILRSIVDNIQDHGYYDQDKLEDVESLTMDGYKEYMNKLDFSDYLVIVQTKGE